MPIDHRRLPVPSESKSPYAIVKESQKAAPLINKDGVRQDGRAPDKVRPIFLRAGVVSQAKGSAYIEMDQTKVICAVYGPREVTRREDFSMQGQLNCEFKYATFSCACRRGHQMDSEERDVSALLYQALSPAVILEKFPKARMDIFVTVLEDDGSALAAAINCASVALSDAGIEMYDLVVGASLLNLGRITRGRTPSVMQPMVQQVKSDRQNGTQVLLDPAGSEEFKSRVAESPTNNGSITLGFMPSLHQVAALVQKGDLDCEVAIESIKVLIEACQRKFPVLQQCLVKAVKTRAQTAKTS